VRKVVSVLLTVVLISVIAGCAESGINPMRDNSERENVNLEEKPESAEYEKDFIVSDPYMEVTLTKGEYSLKEAVEEADLIVDVTIKEWLGQSEKGFETTFYKTQVNNTFKGEMFDTVTIKQAGNSNQRIYIFPLFETGDRMLLFLKKSNADEENKMYGDCYGIVGMYKTVLNVQEYENELFLLNRGVLGFLREFYSDVEQNINENIIEQFYKNHPLLEEIGMIHDVYYYNDLINMISKVIDKGYNSVDVMLDSITEAIKEDEEFYKYAVEFLENVNEGN
jgi:hypothetical protein